MKGTNLTILIGNLGRKPELRDVGQSQLATFSLATTRSWKGKDGQQQEATTWHRIVVWGNQAQHCAQFLDRGSQVYVEGSYESREYQGKDGQPAKTMEVRARNIQFLGGRKADGGGEGQYPAPASRAQPQQQQRLAPHRERDFPPPEGYSGPQDDDTPF